MSLPLPQPGNPQSPRLTPGPKLVSAGQQGPPPPPQNAVDASALASAHSVLPHVHMELASDPSLLCGVRELVNRLARSIGFAETQSSQVALAVDEALANVIRHGYEGRSNARIWIKFWTLAPTNDGPGLRVVVEDLARQVDPALIKSRDLEDIRPGGLGVHIIREVMDSVVYEKRDPMGMRLTMEKRTNTPGKASRPGVACLSSEPMCTSKDAASIASPSNSGHEPHPGHEPGKDHA